MTRLFKPFWLAVQFFTRWPTPSYAQVEASEMGRALAWFPLVGLLMGLTLWGLSFVQGWLSEELVALIILAWWLWSTGGLHLDGAADFADGWLGGTGDKQRALTIMKDSRIGTGGGTVLVLILLAKWILLTELLQTDQAWWLVFIPFFARVGSLALMVTMPYAGENGMAGSMFRHLNSKVVWLWLSLVLGLILWLQPGLVWMALAWFWVRWLVLKTLGGMNGDSAGLMTEVLEIAGLLLLVAILS